MSPAPVALFVYNRPWHTRQTVEALLANPEAKDTDLYVFSDAAKTERARNAVSAVRAYVRGVSGFRSVRIIDQKVNLGLAGSIISGTTEVCDQRGRVIVLEDDIVTSPHFLKYMNAALNLYESNERVISISGYTYPIQHTLPETFFLRGADCWGWATWKRAWDLFEPNGDVLLRELERQKLTHQFDSYRTYPFTRMLRNQVTGKNGSWAIRWHATAFVRDTCTLYPRKTLVHNIGMDGTGEHCAPTDKFYGDLSEGPIDVRATPVEELPWVREQIMQFHREARTSLLGRALRRLRGMLAGARV
ncbi:MAG: glycosyltransferase family protein [Acidiferrobacteraceae bacterium]